MSLYNELCSMLRGRWRRNVPMREYTTMKVGGPADLMVHPIDAEELSMIVRWVSENRVDFFVLGAGTNLIVKDGGIRGVVINMRDSFNYFTLYREDIVSGAGTSIATLSAISIQAQLTGLEFAAGIPGSLGGAVRMNAGAFKHSVSDILNQVKTVDPVGNLKELNREEIATGYRESCIPDDEIMWEASLGLRKEKSEVIREQVSMYKKWRKTHQPAKVHSAGCIFKNPPGLHAGKLIDELGLKGSRYGDACVSEVHANFIINDGNATAKDILYLIEKIQENVMKIKGVKLEREVQVVGED